MASMTWRHLLFAHWPVAAQALRPLIPPALGIDTFEGQAWLGVIPFTMRIAPRGGGVWPLRRDFHELNVRTYVTMDTPDGARPGVWFFSLDAADRLSVRLARAVWRLPYFDAAMSLEEESGWIRYHSVRRRRGAGEAEYAARYRPTRAAQRSAPGSLAAFLTERYCLYAPGRGGGVRRGEIHHEPWLLAPAACEAEVNTMTWPLGVALPDVVPLLHYAAAIDVVAWLPCRA